jgi:ABC-type branched-chain amino acid transport systems, periplasmic component
VLSCERLLPASRLHGSPVDRPRGTSFGAPVQFTAEVSESVMRSRIVILWIFLVFGVLPGPTRAAEIKIGAAEALTGNASQYGLPIRKGFELALSEINASGGINGRKIELVVEDEQGKKEEAINVFKKLIFQDKVLMLFGPTLSNSAQASDPVLKAQESSSSALRIPLTALLRSATTSFAIRSRKRTSCRHAQDRGAEDRLEESRGALRQRRYFHQERLR